MNNLYINNLSFNNSPEKNFILHMINKYYNIEYLRMYDYPLLKDINNDLDEIINEYYPYRYIEIIKKENEIAIQIDKCLS